MNYIWSVDLLNLFAKLMQDPDLDNLQKNGDFTGAPNYKPRYIFIFKNIVYYL